MSLLRRNPKRDGNEAAIVAALRQVGAIVQRLSDPNVPDLLVGYHGLTVLLEVKSGANDLSELQARWMLEWRGGPCRTVYNVQDALEAIGAVDRKRSTA